LAIAASQTVVACTRVAPRRASISVRKTVPWQYAMAAVSADGARLRSVTVSMRGDSLKPAPA